MDTRADRLRRLPSGSRVVVRYRIDGGLTDALGYLLGLDDSSVQVQTRTGTVRVALADVRAAKEVPPPPERRPRSG
ncbi:hypothetical protein KIH31_09770 [Paenarthrobacter sp. DKR-5]|uniref:putative acetyltransferase n=1 Tax=Paenarthrobacter sp. DKR-5 TaxID=2835535 RepID=UPI001BDCCC2A|nr:hypothetical protein [Paenarthrobacter sp. DKR-5]MBT1002893.1 hypothetical protein [Paenarthrobacter sp. DKR-5]